MQHLVRYTVLAPIMADGAGRRRPADDGRRPLEQDHAGAEARASLMVESDAASLELFEGHPVPC
ncbi:hypothetical protein ACFQHV_21275 [Promicromonospora thailandica]|uniref:Uncharacterized protein n=1 Tax=Promicromonospora thailandica TaxID=765201 RepID=A0A9X2G0S5_9MICO|nr:hypothetical protein [Promicromonospora thailandica]MCP2263263.1 hypothetical protein [Promicromonospora thailandica]